VIRSATLRAAALTCALLAFLTLTPGCSHPGGEEDDDSFLPRERDTFAADADADTYAGAAPLAVQFSAKTINGTAPVIYAWDFDDRSGSADQNPAHTFRRPGWYLVTMDARDGAGQSYRINLQLHAWKASEWKRLQKHTDPRIVARSLHELERKRSHNGWRQPTAPPPG
jgi:PKD domain-containing protein